MDERGRISLLETSGSAAGTIFNDFYNHTDTDSRQTKDATVATKSTTKKVRSDRTSTNTSSTGTTTTTAARKAQAKQSPPPPRSPSPSTPKKSQRPSQRSSSSSSISTPLVSSHDQPPWTNRIYISCQAGCEPILYQELPTITIPFHRVCCPMTMTMMMPLCERIQFLLHPIIEHSNSSYNER